LTALEFLKRRGKKKGTERNTTQEGKRRRKCRNYTVTIAIATKNLHTIAEFFPVRRRATPIIPGQEKAVVLIAH
jgi:hypothetical protein